MRHETSFGRRFIAGENRRGSPSGPRGPWKPRACSRRLTTSARASRTLAEAEAATRDYVRVIDAITKAGIGRNLSLKLTQLGLDVDRASAVDNLRHILGHAEGFFVRLDMESSHYTETTLENLRDTVEPRPPETSAWSSRRTCGGPKRDVDRISALGARIRLVKGAYSRACVGGVFRTRPTWTPPTSG